MRAVSIFSTISARRPPSVFPKKFLLIHIPPNFPALPSNTPYQLQAGYSNRFITAFFLCDLHNWYLPLQGTLTVHQNITTFALKQIINISIPWHRSLGPEVEESCCIHSPQSSHAQFFYWKLSLIRVY